MGYRRVRFGIASVSPRPPRYRRVRFGIAASASVSPRPLRYRRVIICFDGVLRNACAKFHITLTALPLEMVLDLTHKVWCAIGVQPTGSDYSTTGIFVGKKKLRKS